MTLSRELIEDALEIYPVIARTLEEEAILVRNECERMAREADVRVRVQHRVKGPLSLERKLLRELDKDEPSERFAEAGRGLDVLRAVRDVIGVRVLPYLEPDCERIKDGILKSFFGEEGPSSHVVVRRGPDITENEHYRAIHCQIGGLRGDTPRPIQGGFSCEIQIAGALAHVWNELEHDIGYKRPDGANTLSDEEKDRLKDLASQLRVGDSLIQQVMDAHRRQLDAPKDGPATTEFGDYFEFVHVMRGHFSAAREGFPRNASGLYEELVRLGLDSEASIVEELFDEDDAEGTAIAELSGLQAHLDEHEASPGVELDPGSSDLLLMLLLRRRAADVARERSRGRPPRVVSIARRYLEWKQPAESEPGVEPGTRAEAPAPDARRPRWQLIEEAALELGEGGASFGLREIVAKVQEIDPTALYRSVQPLVQAMTCNAGSGPPVDERVSSLLFRVRRGWYRLARPLLFLDVEGTVAPMDPDGPPARPAVSQEARAAVRKLSECFEIRWCSDAGRLANEQLEDLPDFPVTPIEGAREIDAKVAKISEWAGDCRAAWVDDKIGPEGERWGHSEHRLAIRVDPAVGIQAAHVEQLLRFGGC